MKLGPEFTMSTKDPKNNERPKIALTTIVLWVLPPTILVLSGLILFSSAGRDDAYITYWPAYTLAEGGEILNYNGDRVEQSSSLLQVLALAALNKLTGLDMVLLGHLFSIACGALVVSFAMVLARSIHPKISIPAGILTATSTFLVYWSYGGLETTLQTLLAVLLVNSVGHFLTHERLNGGWLTLSAFTVLGLLICRPESFIVLLAVFSGLLVFITVPWLTRPGFTTSRIGVLQRRICVLLSITGIFTITLFTFRKIYFDSLFPQPVIAKSFHSNLIIDILRGLRYILRSSIASPFNAVISMIVVVCSILVVRSIYRGKCKNVFLIISVIFVGVQLSFTVFSGGDWMEGGRFLVPIIPFLSIYVLYSLFNAKMLAKQRFLVILTVFMLQVGGLVHFSFNKSTGIPIWNAIECYRNFALSLRATDYSWFELTNRVHMRDIPMLIRLQSIIDATDDRKAEKVVILSSFMGMMPYYMSMRYGPERVQFIDTCGLVERSLTSCSVTAAMPRTPYGLALDISGFLEILPEAENLCNIRKPDVIVGVQRSPSDMSRIEAHGYKIAYSQEEYVRRETGLTGLGSITSDRIYIAVRRELDTGRSTDAGTVTPLRQTKEEPRFFSHHQVAIKTPRNEEPRHQKRQNWALPLGNGVRRSNRAVFPRTSRYSPVGRQVLASTRTDIWVAPSRILDYSAPVPEL